MNGGIVASDWKEEETSTILTLTHIHLTSPCQCGIILRKRFIYLSFTNSTFHSSSLSQFTTSFNSKRILNSPSCITSRPSQLDSLTSLQEIDRLESEEFIDFFLIHHSRSSYPLSVYRQYPYPKTLSPWGTKIPLLWVSKCEGKRYARTKHTHIKFTKKIDLR